jgi:deoxyguanosine kinase
MVRMSGGPMYLAVEGVIGAGKTSLARLLQPEFESELLLEAFEENPFLSDFYADRQRYAFQTQIFFLLSRYHQQREVVPSAVSRGSLLADYTFAKDRLFAQLNLQGDELDTYQQVHEALAERIPDPDLVIYLKVDTDTALHRIALRDRPYERDMSRSYIDELNQAYESHFGRTGHAGVLVIEASHLDFVNHTSHLRLITERVRAALGIPPFQAQLPLDDNGSNSAEAKRA